MKYIKRYVDMEYSSQKTFEGNSVDSILDKISRYGMKALTQLEKEYLDQHWKGDAEDLERELKHRRDRLGILWDYDPREDQEFFSEIGFDFSGWSDEEIEHGRYSIMWDDCDEVDIQHFVELFDITDAKDANAEWKAWDMLSKETQDKFKEYITEIY